MMPDFPKIASRAIFPCFLSIGRLASLFGKDSFLLGLAGFGEPLNPTLIDQDR